MSSEPNCETDSRQRAWGCPLPKAHDSRMAGIRHGAALGSKTQLAQSLKSCTGQGHARPEGYPLHQHVSCFDLQCKTENVSEYRKGSPSTSCALALKWLALQPHMWAARQGKKYAEHMGSILEPHAPVLLNALLCCPACSPFYGTINCLNVWYVPIYHTINLLIMH